MFKDLSGEQIRQIIDAEQVFEAYRDARLEHDTRYRGSMVWKDIKGKTYLVRRARGADKSLGPRSPETEAILAAFEDGKSRLRQILEGTSRRLDEMAPVNRAMRIARFPKLAAKIVRRLDEAGLLGRNVLIVGTNALYAYERAAGVQIDSEHLATGDVDLLFDARSRLKLALDDFHEEGVIGLLRRVDNSFKVAGRKSYRAINQAGFMVDLIKPAPRDPLRPSGPASLGDAEGDLRAAEIFGLSWLLNSPKFEQTVIGEDGYPCRTVSPDPRAFALHKAWLSERQDRDPGKRRRDLAQARLIARLAAERLGLAFDDDALRGLPAKLRSEFLQLASSNHAGEAGPAPTTPRW